ncbi:MAG: hypothetical protein JWN17_1732 [Frankiales bacterium]|nr:hypothetical protein [Frankiales bacterium]
MSSQANEVLPDADGTEARVAARGLRGSRRVARRRSRTAATRTAATRTHPDDRLDARDAADGRPDLPLGGTR